MPQGENEFDYTETLIPTRVTLTRQRGDITYVFEVDGFRGSETGQIYYNGKDVLEVEQFLDRQNAILQQEFEKIGLVVNFTTPETRVSPEYTATNRALRSPLFFRPSSTVVDFRIAYGDVR